MRLLSLSATCAVALIFIASSCTAPKKVPYIQDAEEIPAEVLSEAQSITDPVITYGDLLNIEVTGINMSAMAPFNKGRYVDADGKISSMSGSANINTGSGGGSESSTQFYLVNADGCIDFPIVGKIKVVGLTKTQVADEIIKAIYPKFVTEKPTVDIRLMNFRVVVAGAVKSPGVKTVRTERMNMLEALAMAGDLDIKGDRENILIYRTNPDGTREVHRVNIHDKDFLLSPYYNLQQNDYIYVVPNHSMRQGAWALNPAVGATITIVGGLSSIASLVVGLINLAKK